MKALRYILLSYLQQHFFGVLIIVVGFIYFVPGTLMALFGKYGTIRTGFEPWKFFFISFIFILYGVAMHLRSLIKTNTGALLPHYRRNQLIAAGFIVAVFVFVPILCNGLRGFPVLAPLAMFLFTAALILWGLFNFGDNLAVLAVIIWLGKLVHEFLGFKLKIMIFRSLPDFFLLGSKSLFPILVILLSCGLIFLFGLFVLKMPYKDLWDSPKDRTDPFTMDYDRVNNVTLKIMRGKMAALLRNMTGHKKRSLFQVARVLQPALFSPGYSSVLNGLIYTMVVLCYIGTIGCVFYSGIDFAKSEMKFSLSSFLVLGYFIGAGMLSQDLLQHRHRLADLWLRVQLNSRKAFARAAILTYLLVTVRQFFMSTILVFSLLALLRVPFLKSLLVAAAGFVVYTAILAFALLNSEQVVSAECKGWMITVMVVGISASAIFAVIAKGSAYRSPGIWWFILAAEVFCLFLLWRAVKEWSDIEMNFAAPPEGHRY